MAREPKHLNEADMQQIADKVRVRLLAQFGRDRVSKFMRADLQVAEAFARQTYIAVREQIELEL